ARWSPARFGSKSRVGLPCPAGTADDSSGRLVEPPDPPNDVPPRITRRARLDPVDDVPLPFVEGTRPGVGGEVLDVEPVDPRGQSGRDCVEQSRTYPPPAMLRVNVELVDDVVVPVPPPLGDPDDVPSRLGDDDETGLHGLRDPIPVPPIAHLCGRRLLADEWPVVILDDFLAEATDGGDIFGHCGAHHRLIRHAAPPPERPTTPWPRSGAHPWPPCPGPPGGRRRASGGGPRLPTPEAVRAPPDSDARPPRIDPPRARTTCAARGGEQRP